MRRVRDPVGRVRVRSAWRAGGPRARGERHRDRVDRSRRRRGRGRRPASRRGRRGRRRRPGRGSRRRPRPSAGQSAAARAGPQAGDAAPARRQRARPVASKVPSRPSSGVSAATRRRVPTFRRSWSASTRWARADGAFQVGGRPAPAADGRQRDPRRRARVQLAEVERLAAVELAVLEPVRNRFENSAGGSSWSGAGPSSPAGRPSPRAAAAARPPQVTRSAGGVLWYRAAAVRATLRAWLDQARRGRTRPPVPPAGRPSAPRSPRPARRPARPRSAGCRDAGLGSRPDDNDRGMFGVLPLDSQWSCRDGPSRATADFRARSRPRSAVAAAPRCLRTASSRPLASAALGSSGNLASSLS